jgi:hypothetical protein
MNKETKNSDDKPGGLEYETRPIFNHVVVAIIHFYLFYSYSSPSDLQLQSTRNFQIVSYPYMPLHAPYMV